MIRGLPQRISVAVPVDLTGALMVEMWIKDMGSKETTYHTLPDIDVESGEDESVISYVMSEDEAPSIVGFFLLIQCRWIDAHGESGTYVEKTRVDPALWNRPIKMKVGTDE